MRSYHASVLMPEMPASRAEFCCHVAASSLSSALRKIGGKVRAHVGRRRIATARITVRVGIELPKRSNTNGEIAKRDDKTQAAGVAHEGSALPCPDERAVIG